MTPEERLAQRERELDERERWIEEAEERWQYRNEYLLDTAAQQAIALVVLRKMRERNWLNRGDLDELAHATNRVASDDYRPAARLAAILDEKFHEREERKKRQSSERDRSS